MRDRRRAERKRFKWGLNGERMDGPKYTFWCQKMRTLAVCTSIRDRRLNMAEISVEKGKVLTAEK